MLLLLTDKQSITSASACRRRSVNWTADLQQKRFVGGRNVGRVHSRD